jgi:hypothetical protein
VNLAIIDALRVVDWSVRMSNIAANPISKALCRMTTKDHDLVPMIGVAGIELYVVLRDCVILRGARRRGPVCGRPDRMRVRRKYAPGFPKARGCIKGLSTAETRTEEEGKKSILLIRYSHLLKPSCYAVPEW